MATNPTPLLHFSATSRHDRTRSEFDKEIQQRASRFDKLLPTYDDSVNAKKYVKDLKILIENSGLGHHQGLIVAALLNAMPMDTRLGSRIRARIDEVRERIIQEHPGRPDEAPVSFSMNGARYVLAVFKALLDAADEDEESVKDLKIRWKALKMLESESVQEYFDRATELLTALRQKHVQYGHDDQVIDVLAGLRERADAINPTFYTTVANSDCKTLVSLLLCIKRIHGNMPKTFRSKFPIRMSDRILLEEAVRQVEPVLEEENGLQEGDGAGGGQEEPTTVTKKRKDRGDKKFVFEEKDFELPCYKCEAEGKPTAQFHAYAFCYSNPLSEITLRSKVKRNNGGPSGPSKKAKIKCFNCNELGHISRDCPKKKKQGGDDSVSRVELKKSILQEIAEERRKKEEDQKHMMDMIRVVFRESQARSAAAPGSSNPPWG